MKPSLSKNDPGTAPAVGDRGRSRPAEPVNIRRAFDEFDLRKIEPDIPINKALCWITRNIRSCGAMISAGSNDNRERVGRVAGDGGVLNIGVPPPSDVRDRAMASRAQKARPVGDTPARRNRTMRPTEKAEFVPLFYRDGGNETETETEVSLMQLTDAVLRLAKSIETLASVLLRVHSEIQPH
ncbi:MAG: hypothetical protein ACLQUZ_06785 [Rhizomicrobium sp.]